jgi:hypothetical protein
MSLYDECAINGLSRFLASRSYTARRGDFLIQ